MNRILIVALILGLIACSEDSKPGKLIKPTSQKENLNLEPGLVNEKLDSILLDSIPLPIAEPIRQEIEEILPPPEPVPEVEEIIVFSEIEASFPGGKLELEKFIYDEMNYPPMAKEMEIQGVVFVQFDIEKDGSVARVKVVREVENSVDIEARRIIKRMPKWRPAEQGGRRVISTHVQPIKFILY